MILYFATSPRKDELNAIRIAKPSHILVSFSLWKHKNLTKYIQSFGYRPTVMLDSGAFTFFNQNILTGIENIFEMYTEDVQPPGFAAIQVLYDIFGTNIDFEELHLFHHFMNYVFEHRAVVDHIITADVIGDPPLSYYAYRLMKAAGTSFTALPVFHYGQPLSMIGKYIMTGATYIALGGSANIKGEGKKKKRVAWVNEVTQAFPNVHFHLLGSQDRYILERTPLLYSADGTAWNTSAGFKRDRGNLTKVEKAVQNIYRMQTFAKQYGNSV